MRWLPDVRPRIPRPRARHLVSVHRAFLYDMGAADIETRGASRRAAACPLAHRGRNPYSRLAMDIMRVSATPADVLSPSIVAYLKMLVMLGTLRHELATNYDLSVHVQRFFSG